MAGISPQDAFGQLKDFKPLEFLNIRNAASCEEEASLPVRSFSDTLLNPAPEQDIISPFISTAFLPKNRDQFALHQRIRQAAATRHWASVRNLLTHLERKQWDLFDTQWELLELEGENKSEAARIKSAFRAIEEWEKVFAPGSDRDKETVQKRIALGRATSRPLMQELVDFFQSKAKDESLYRELVAIRNRWAEHYVCLSPIYIRFYWDESKHKLDPYSITEKRFEELKFLYVESFETFCRISVIAAGIEGIIHKGKVGVPLTNRVMDLTQFETIANGNKPDMLKQLKITDLFVPFIDHKLRNGIGHHSAYYDVATDSVFYRVENANGIQDLKISYTLFCEKVVNLYRQLHVVSLYVHWLRQSALGVM